MHNLKVVSYVLFGDFTEYNSPETASHIALRNYSKEVREEPGYIVVFPENKQTKNKQMWLNVKILLLITKNRHFKLMILMLFCIWEDARVWAH